MFCCFGKSHTKKTQVFIVLAVLADILAPGVCGREALSCRSVPGSAGFRRIPEDAGGSGGFGGEFQTMHIHRTWQQFAILSRSGTFVLFVLGDVSHQAIGFETTFGQVLPEMLLKRVIAREVPKIIKTKCHAIFKGEFEGQSPS